MKAQECLLLFAAGVVFWIGGTLWFQARGAPIFESTALRFWINFAVTPVATTAVCIGVLLWRRIPAHTWASAGLLLAIPGMVGEAILLSHFAQMMPRMQPVTAGRYGAFLFATYALFLAIAEAVTLRANG
jgi:hypothetical protein